MARERLLINWVYCRPVGHVVEALKRTRGFYLANRDKDVYLLLNSASPTELAESCPWIKKIYPVDVNEVYRYGEKAECLRVIPKVWDYIVHDDRTLSFKKGWDEKELIRAQAILQRLLKARMGQCYINGEGRLSRNILPYRSNPKVTLPIPERARRFVKRYRHNGPTICVMLGGSAGGIQSPTVEMWLRICTALSDAIPNLKFYFTGVSRGRGGRTSTTGFTMKDVGYLTKQLPDAEAAYDIGLWNQLALMEKCDIFMSPHTGFAFLAPLVGTPWLALSNCRWSEYIFNDLKFYSVLPECGYYPALGDSKKGCGWLLAHDRKALCMTNRMLARKIPEIVHGAELLLDPKFTYRRALTLHLEKIRKPPYDPKRFTFLDGV